MNQVKARMNNASGMSVEFPPSEEPRDVTPLVASKLDEVHPPGSDRPLRP